MGADQGRNTRNVMENSTEISTQFNDKPQRLSVRDFLLFSLFIYPLGLLLFISQNELINFFHSRLVFEVISFVIFSIINFIWGQLKIRPLLLVLSCSIGLFFSLKLISNGFVDFLPNIPMTLLGAIIIYLGIFLVFQFFQFFTWIPLIIKFVWQNRNNLDKLPFR